MNLLKRILSTLLAVTLLAGACATVLTVGASADGTQEESYKGPISMVDDKGKDMSIGDFYSSYLFETPEDKLATMKPMYTDASGRYRLYAEERTGEIACKDLKTGQILFTNPYDAASISGTNSQTDAKDEALSQILISYSTNTSKAPLSVNSFRDAAADGQIKVQAIKKGIRVEYTIGKEDTKRLVPKLILEEDFQKYILDPIERAKENGEISITDYENFVEYNDTWWLYYDLNDPMYLNVEKLGMEETYPFLRDFVEISYEGNTQIRKYPGFYVIDESLTSENIQWLETIIKKCTDYSYEQLEEDHARTKFEEEAAAEPVFKLALEYYVDESGLSVRLPSNGIRYDMTNFTLESITVIPFMGAGSYNLDGYAFFPDGSGALFDYEIMRDGNNSPVSGVVYGADFAYNVFTEIRYQKIVRYPVYGAVSTEKIYEYTYLTPEGNTVTDYVSANICKDMEAIRKYLPAGCDLISCKVKEEYQRGYFAVVEAADSLSTLTMSSGGGTAHKYCTLNASFNPKPKDKYSLTAGGTASISVVSERKYTGSLTIRYTMLCSDDIANGVKQTDPSFTYYDTSWMGMAKAYRDYLTANGTLRALEATEVQNDIPLYIESFGALETQETVATIPVYMMTPLTTFGNILEMYDTFATNGIKNINFKMTGFANGGMYYEVPSALKWEKSVGGKKGFKELIAKAAEVNGKNDGSHLGLYPDFDFAYIQTNTLFDAVSLKDDAVKTIDNRYTSYRQYSPTQQTFVTFYQLALSPSRYDKFYTKLIGNYEKYDIKSISLSTLGTALNSDFDEEEPYNREDNKDFTKQALSYIYNKGYSIMTDGGNAYTWGYVDHILNIDLDSTRYLNSSASVPFIGTVLHGSIQFAGTPLNEEGDVNYALLRAIENGAGMQFILSFQNTEKLKNDENLSQYYSIRYDIWKNDVISYYKELNQALWDVQTKLIIDHEFLKGERMLDLDELQTAIKDKLDEAERLEDQIKDNENNIDMNSFADAWALLYGAQETLDGILSKINLLNASVTNSSIVANRDFSGVIGAFKIAAEALTAAKTATNAAKTALDDAKKVSTYDDISTDPAVIAAQATYDAAVEDQKLKNTAYTDAMTPVVTQLSENYAAVLSMIDSKIELDALKAQADEIFAKIPVAMDLMENTNVFDGDDATYQTLKAQMQAYKTAIEAGAYETNIGTAYATHQAALDLASAASAFATAAQKIKDGFIEPIYGLSEEDQDDLMEKCRANQIFTMEMLNNLYTVEFNKSATATTPSNTTEADTSRLVDNNRIVAVTYGTGSDPYKTFILNYNSYSVRVTYEGKTYTIASGEYVVVTYPTATA